MQRLFNGEKIYHIGDFTKHVLKWKHGMLRVNTANISKGKKEAQGME